MIALLWSLCPVHAQEAAQPARVNASLVVAVSKRDAAADALVAFADEVGGWFASRTDEGLSLRVPVQAVDAVLERATEEGKVLARSIQRDDLGQELADLEGRLSAREDVLDEYFKLLSQAGPKAIVTVERQIVLAIDEIERIKGRLQLLQDQAQYGRVDIDFRFRDRGAPARDGNSSWAWINTLNVQDVISGHQTASPDWKSRGASFAEPPADFSAWKKRGRYRAASSDNVMVRIRTVKDKAEADLEFWREAVRTRMDGAGYRVISESDLLADGDPGAVIELAAPLGTEDWSYLIAMFPSGRRIVLVEAAGEVSDFAARRDAIVEAIEQVKL